MKDKAIKLTQLVYSSVKKLVINNQLLTFFVLGNALNTVILIMLTTGQMISISPVLADLAFSLIIASFIFFMKPKNEFRYLFIWTLVLTTLYIGNVTYYKFFQSFLSVSMLSVASQLGEVGDSVTGLITIDQVVYIWFPIALYLYNRRLIKKNKKKVEKKKEVRLNYFKTSVALSAVLLILFSFNLSGSDWTRLYRQWNREYLVMKFGLSIYHINDVFRSVFYCIHFIFFIIIS